jgi:protein ImuB
MPCREAPWDRPPRRRLWIALHLPDLSLESWTATLDAGAQGGPLALLDGACIAACNGAAAALGVQPGLRRATALALAPGLCFGLADARRDACALRAVAHAALEFTPAVTLHGADTVLLEVTSSLRLFGGLPRLLERLRGLALAPLGHRVAAACAPTALGAALLARQGLPEAELCGPHATRLTVLRARLDAAPAALLWAGGAAWRCGGAAGHGGGVAVRGGGAAGPGKATSVDGGVPGGGVADAADSIARLQGLGLATLGELRALPRDGLARRFGPSLLEALDRARGDAPDPQDWVTAPEVYAERLELHTRADTAAQLQHGAQALLARLVAWARARQGRVPRCALQMRHEPRHRADDTTPASTTLELALAEPSADADHLQGLLRERLDRLVLPAPVLELRLHCAELARSAPPDGELFPTRATEQAGLARLLERLQARLGPARVQRLQPVDDHRPERAAQAAPLVPDAAGAGAVGMTRGRGMPRPPGAPLSAGPAAPAADPGTTPVSVGLHGPPAAPATPTPRLTRPVWLLPEPQRLAERGPQPLWTGRPLQLRAGPERIEAGWWDGAPAGRDYFVAQAHDGTLAWIYRSRLPASQDETGWFLQGWFA